MALRLAFYGDDFTGSSAVMEVLDFAGIPTVMFLRPPGPEALARFPGVEAVGIAGTARAESPAWMDRELPPAFRALAALGAPLLHYKVCSTFDSAPGTGSIGRAVEIGLAVTGARLCPVVVGAPAIGRWTAFGTLFAAVGGAVHRLDRHPVMSRHPVTPMDEADLPRHLARQTALPIGLVDFRDLLAGCGDAALAREQARGARVVFLDLLDAGTEAAAGAVLAAEGGFCAGSQGVEYALVAHWRRTGALPAAAPSRQAGAVARIAAVCGSCSPLTAAQIGAALAAGFAGVAVDATRAVDAVAWAAEVERAAQAGLAALSAGNSVIAYTARGPEGPEVAALRSAVAAAGADAGAVNRRIGQGLGQLLARLRQGAGLARIAVAGGDTSGQAMTAMGLDALTPLAPLAPGAPLCRAHGGAAEGAEITLKGGQMGGEDFFLRLRDPVRG